MNSKRKIALITGISLLLMAVIAGFAYGYVYTGLVDAKDATGTLHRIREQRILFNSGIAAWIVIFILDLMVTKGVFSYFKGSHATGAMITAGLRLIYTVMLGIAIVQLLSVPSMLYAEDAAEKVLPALHGFEEMWSLGLIVFGGHLIGLGILALRSVDIKRIFGWMLILAGAGYCFVHGLKNAAPSHTTFVAQAEAILALPMMLGELLFALWLVARGGKTV
ncbi:MAG: DUF4386 domain-containing protein [Bacteroidetes bacterium]|nr:DUF4386 domain-containing protein [Bacteroidota bacterium]